MCSVDVAADVGRDNAPGDDENDKLARHDPHAASAGPGMCHQPAWAERRTNWSASTKSTQVCGVTVQLDV